MRKTIAVLLLSVAALLSSDSADGGNWPHWRGANHDGLVTGTGFPTTWAEDENIAWKVKLPGWGTSSPIIWGERIFLSCTDSGKNSLICLNRKGKRQWQANFGDAASNRNRKAGAANPSPTTDGTHVYSYYKSGDLACVDFDNKIVWQINVQDKHGRDRLNWDLGSSPVLTKTLVVVTVMHAGPSYLVAFDKTTGKEVWKQDRDLGAPREARDSYSTPIIIEEAGQEILVVLGADHVTAHAATTGKEVWRVGGLNPTQQGNFRSIASPVSVAGTIIAPYARGRTLTAIRSGGKGDVTKSHVGWTIDGSSADVPSPVAYKGRVYLCGDRGEIACVDVKTGKNLWTERLPRNRYPYSASPIIAEGRLYATREDGTTFVLEIGDKPKLIATNTLQENTYATPAFADGQIYLRSSDFLFCLGEK